MAQGRIVDETLGIWSIALLVVFAAGWLVAKTGMGCAIDPATLPAVEREFAEKMNGAALVGRFTIRGREDRAATPDRYDLYNVEKVGPGSVALQRQDRRIGRDRCRSSCA